MKIYPKVSEYLEGMNVLKEYIQNNKGMEIQMLSWDEIDKIYGIIQKIKQEIPDIEEITIHPPLKEWFNFEVLTFDNSENNRINWIIKASNDFNIKINLLYHTRWNFECWKKSGVLENLKEIIDELQDTNVNIVLENMFSMVDKENCTVLQIAKEINNSHLGVCLDTCHLHCQANIFKKDFNEFLDNYLNIDDCNKYVYQIHFAGTLENDGFINMKTHGRKHNSLEDCKTDFDDILIKYNIQDKIIVTEISEENYDLRKDQFDEIKMLEQIDF